MGASESQSEQPVLTLKTAITAALQPVDVRDGTGITIADLIELIFRYANSPECKSRPPISVVASRPPFKRWIIDCCLPVCLL